ncbi:MAG: hypothetical protein Q8N96_02255, partial [Methylovulum sp.]|nr:hypothetical protein [Methylovulum sp.]
MFQSTADLIYRMTKPPTDRGRWIAPPVNGGVTAKDNDAGASLSNTEIPLKGEVSDQQGISMKKISLIIMLWMLNIVIAAANIPKADLSMTALNPGQWPAQYRISLKIPQDHHAYLNTGDE